MNTATVFIAVVLCCCFSRSQAHALPGHFLSGGNHQQLTGVPDLSSYGKLTYPKYDILDLGSSSKDSLPPAVVEITKHVTVKVPKPYPVKVPVKVPYPVHIPKPYKVVETKLVEVPVEVPIEVEKKVPIHIEVPKPYPVHVDHHQEGGYHQEHQAVGWSPLENERGYDSVQGTHEDQ